MTHKEYVPADQEEADHLRELAAEFAHGFDVEELARRRVPGHPLVLGNERATTVTVRLLPDMLERLERLARERHLSRSEVIRQALDRELAESA